MTEIEQQDEVDDEPRPGEELDDDISQPENPGGAALVTSDRQMQLADAQPLAARRGLTIALLAGPNDAGKTTLLTKLWSSLLADARLGSAAFAGSWTSLGFERRDWTTRAASREASPHVPRTHQEDDGFLHLRLHDGRDLREIMLSDMAGETFKRILNDTPVDEVLEWSARLNCVAVCVNAEAIADGAQRSNALEAARLLLVQLRAAARPRIAVVLTKADKLGGHEERWQRESEKLLTLARGTDADASIITTAALPESGSPRGLEEFIDWVVATRDEEDDVSVQLPRASRTAGRIG